MKIIQLSSENFKRIQAVEITPDENFQIIGGLNGQGKSSVLDAIWAGLEGGEALKNTDKPIRNGEETARIQIDLGDILVTRTFKEGKKPTLVVSSKDGAKYSSPQAMLDKLIGQLSFDPSAFANMDAKKQKEVLQELVGIDFTQHNLARQEAYTKRTAVNQEVKRLSTHLETFQDIPEGTPDVELSAVSVLQEIKEAQLTIQNNDKYRTHVRLLEESLSSQQREIEHLETELVRMTQLLETKRTSQLEIVDKYRAGKDYIDTLVDPVTTELEVKLNNVEIINKAVRAKNDRAAVDMALKAQEAQSEALTQQIKAIDGQKEMILETAKFPIDGLSFDEEGITYKDIPFKQCCTTERLKTSVAIAMAMNPTLRIIRIMDGSLLDASNLKMIEEMAIANDYQVWVEIVDNTGTMGIQIEDGQVKENEQAK